MSDRHISLLFFSLMKNRMTDFDQQTYARMRLEGVKYKLNENGSFLLKGFFFDNFNTNDACCFNIDEKSSFTLP
jgi:hypothetical protein